ncbi:hypothetical protein MTO96_014811 [Rhipicephalus appendiculatus]
MARSKADPCVYISKKKLIVGVYVDDLLIIAETEKEIANLKSRLGEKFDAKDLGEARHILSIRLKKERDGRLTLDQTAYAEDILETFGIADAKKASSLWILDESTKEGTTTAQQERTSQGGTEKQSVHCFTSLEVQGLTWPLPQPI